MLSQIHEPFDDAALRVTRRLGRALAAGLGTAIGIGTLVASASISSSATFSVRQSFDALRATEVAVQFLPEVNGSFPSDSDERLARIPGVVSGGRILDMGDVEVVADTASDHLRVDLVGLSTGAAEAIMASPTAGRLPSADAPPGTREVAAGILVADDLGFNGARFPRLVKINGVNMTLVGLFDVGPFRPELAGAFITSTEFVDSLSGSPPSEVVIRVETGAAEHVARFAPLALVPEDPDGAIALVPPDPKNLAVEVVDTLDGLTTFVIVVLLIAGTVGIGVVSFASVMERQREIGMRRALGAGPFDILAMVLFESSVIGWLGAAIGSGLGTIAAIAYTNRMGWDTVIDPRLSLLAPLVGLASGAIGGLFPAVRAVMVQPIQALRS